MGTITKDSGMLAYFEVCQKLADPSWNRANDSAGSPYIFRGDQWIGFDDESSIAAKVISRFPRQLTNSSYYT